MGIVFLLYLAVWAIFVWYLYSPKKVVVQKEIHENILFHAIYPKKEVHSPEEVFKTLEISGVEPSFLKNELN